MNYKLKSEFIWSLRI